MEWVAGALVYSPTDLTHFLECEYLTRLDVDVASGREIGKRRNAEADLLAAKGEEHERGQLERFAGEGRRIVAIPDPRLCGWAEAARQTTDALAGGAEVIYQAVFIRGGWRGKADFLVRTEAPSALGAWSYEAWDSKLARHAKPSHLLQLAFYSECLAALQRVDPEWMRLILGTGEQPRFRYRDFSSYFRVVRTRFARAIHSGVASDPYPVAYCALCGYEDHCDEHWKAVDHLSQIAGIRRDQVAHLIGAGVGTCEHLAQLAGAITGIGPSALDRLRHQAGLQTGFRRTGIHRYDLLIPSEENGLRLLPPPSPGDVFFDMEGYPFFDPTGGLEYLFGIVDVDGTRPAFRAFRGLDRAGEKRAFEHFIDFVWARLERWPDLHIYHYAAYEPTALKRLMTLHATREEQVDELLRREAFVDLYQVVRRSIRISHDSYSIKSVRQFFMPEAGRGEVTGGAQSIVEFQRFLDTGDEQIVEAIERYNEEDCISTLKLRDWLLERKRDAEQQFGVAIPFRALPDRRDEPVAIDPDEHTQLRARLATAGLPFAGLLGQLLDYHRREAKPEWWAFFDRRKKSLDELMDDTEAVACLSPVGEPVPVDRSLVYELAFPPQEFKLKEDTRVEGPLGTGHAGTIEWLDASKGRLGLRRGLQEAGEPLPQAIIAGKPIPDTAQRKAIVRVAEATAGGRSPYTAVEDILQCDAPRFRSGGRRPIQTLDLESQRRLVSELDDSYLFVQGPPGSGKTWTGARLITHLLKAGCRIGVTGPSHRAIHNLLAEIERVAAKERIAFTGLKKRGISRETAFDGRFITSTESNDECAAANAQLIAGTAWLFARSGMNRSFDYLFVDEAGQMALADAVAVGTAARNSVLLGDPQQLPHVTRNAHPDGSGRSVLEHLLGDSATVADDRGLFLAESWRMHPAVCRFVSELSYEGRLVSAPGCEQQSVASAGLSGAGPKYLPVDHRHNSQQSAEEAEAIRAEIARLLDGTATVTDRHGDTRPLLAADILVVAPYNMQVRALRELLPDDVDVGTVDRFQGREAAIVFFSMTSSSGDDVPRGLEFLFNRNRLNVAVSRAKCLPVIVSSPRLLETKCRTIEQMGMVNAVCRFAEIAAAAAI
jgi:predicted RecB family nuclease